MATTNPYQASNRGTRSAAAGCIEAVDSHASVFSIFGDTQVEADWFRGLSSRLEGAQFIRIAGRGKNPEAIERLIQYDRPDIILLANDQPVLVLEKTRTVPSGHNVGQRMARLVRAAELRVFPILFMPYGAMKHGTYAGKRELNIRLLKALKKMAEIHCVPVVSIEWPADKHSELVIDGTENKDIARLVNDFLGSRFNHQCTVIGEAQKQMEAEFDRRRNARASYGEPPNSVEVVETGKLLGEHPNVRGDPQLLRARDKTLVYTIRMSPEKCRRQDPYTGMQFVYDYAECRTGPNVNEKSMNLALRFPNINIAHWLRSNPNDSSTKSCNWYLTANAMIFADGLLILR